MLRRDEGRGQRYIKISRGYKAGGVNVDPDLPSSRQEFEPETLYSFELGVKNRRGPGGFVSATHVFFMYRENVQVKKSFQDDPTDPSSYIFYLDNATSGYSYGLEWESSWYLDSGLFASSHLFVSDGFYFSNSHDQKSENYELINLSLGYEKEDFVVSAWIKNIFNRAYSNRGFFFSNEPPDWQEKLYLQPGEPRSTGISLTYNF